MSVHPRPLLNPHWDSGNSSSASKVSSPSLLLCNSCSAWTAFLILDGDVPYWNQAPSFMLDVSDALPYFLTFKFAMVCLLSLVLEPLILCVSDCSMCLTACLDKTLLIRFLASAKPFRVKIFSTLEQRFKFTCIFCKPVRVSEMYSAKNGFSRTC